MYTELVLKCEIKKDTPVEARCILEFLFGTGDDIPKEIIIPNHPFFKCERWSTIGRCSSYYHTPFPLSEFKEDYIFSRSDFKKLWR